MDTCRDGKGEIFQQAPLVLMEMEIYCMFQKQFSLSIEYKNHLFYVVDIYPSPQQGMYAELYLKQNTLFSCHVALLSPFPQISWF